MIDTDTPEKLYTIELTHKEHKFFQKWLKEQMEIEESKSIEFLIKWAKRYKKTAKELYPNKEFECWVDEDSKMMHFEVKGDDSFWRNITTAEVMIKVRQKIDEEDKKDKINRRIYV